MPGALLQRPFNTGLSYHKSNIFRSKRDFELNKATYDTEVNTAKAEAEMAYGLQEAKVRSKIKEEEMQVRTELRFESL